MRARSKVEEEEESEEEDEIEEDEDTEVRRSPRLVGTPVAVSPAVVPILVPQGRRVRGVEGEMGELADRLNPQVPGPFIGPLPLAGTSWGDIDRLGTCERVLNPFLSMSTAH
jgi:hypothetical protein